MEESRIGFKRKVRKKIPYLNIIRFLAVSLILTFGEASDPFKQTSCSDLDRVYRKLAYSYHPDGLGSHDSFTTFRRDYESKRSHCKREPRKQHWTQNLNWTYAIIQDTAKLLSCVLLAFDVLRIICCMKPRWSTMFLSSVGIWAGTPCMFLILCQTGWEYASRKPSARELLERRKAHCTTLNGSHGEVTGKDDVKDKAKDNRREAANRVKRKTLVQKTIEACVPKDVSPAPMPVLSEEPVYKPWVCVADYGVWDRVPALGLKGEVVRVERVNGELVGWGSDGDHYPVRVAGQYACQRVKPGVYVDDFDVDEIRTIAGFELKEISQAGRVEKKWVCKPAFDDLVKNFLNPVLEERNINGFIAFILKTYPLIGSVYISNTVEAYVAFIRDLQHKVYTESTLRGLKIKREVGTRVKLDVVDTIAVPMAMLPVSCNVGSVFYTWGVENPIEDLTDNGMFEVRDLKNCRIRPGHPTLVDFNTPKNEKPKLYRTNFFRLSGPDVNKQFVMYDRSGENMTRASARMYKSKPNEALLVRNQFNLFNFLPFDDFLDREVSNAYHCERSYQGFLEEVNRVGDQDQPDPQTVEFIRSGYKRLLEDTADMRYGDGYSLFSYLLVQLWSLMCIFGLMVKVFLPELARWEFVNAPRVKKQLYLQWYHLLGWYFQTNTVFSARPEAKVKVEFGKPGKLARLYVTYEDCILQAGWMYDWLKAGFCRVYSENTNLEFPYFHEVYKSKRSDHFQHTLPGFYGRSFSDDGQLEIVFPNGDVYNITTDISSCDTSMRSAIFRYSARLMESIGCRYIVKAVFNPFKQKINLVNPSNHDERYSLKPLDIFMGSGSPDTTHMNNIFKYGIMRGMYIEVVREFGFNGNQVLMGRDVEVRNRISAALHRGAAAMGAVITVGIHDRVGQTDFLKEVSYPTPSGVVTGLALGPILRGLGSIVGDLSAIQLGVSPAQFREMSEVERMEHFVGGVVRGLCNEPKSIIMDALRERFTEGTCVIQPGYFVSQVDRSQQTIPLQSLIERYGGDEVDWFNLAAEMKRISVGDYLSSKILGLIFQVDYSLAM